MKKHLHFEVLLVTACMAVLLTPNGLSMTFSHARSTIIGTLSGRIGVAYETVVPYGPSVNLGRFFDPNSQTYFNGGSYSGSAVGMGFNGNYQITQSSPIGSDGLQASVSLTANASASVSPDGIPFWNIRSGLYASAKTDTRVNLVFSGSSPNGSYVLSFLSGWSSALPSVNGSRVANGVSTVYVKADLQGQVRFTGTLTAKAATSSGSVVENVQDAFHLQLSPASAAQHQLLNGAIQGPFVFWDPGPPGRYWIRIRFVPQDGSTLQQAAQTLGYDHFNFRNLILSVPRGWEITDNGQNVVAADGGIPPHGLVDPLPRASSGTGRFVTDTRKLLRPSFKLNFDDPPNTFDSTTGGYYNQSYVTDPGVLAQHQLDFTDSPSKAPVLFEPGDRVSYVTQLVGEDSNGNIIGYVGPPIYWWSDQVADDSIFSDGTTKRGGIYFSTFPGQTNFGPFLSGGITEGVPNATLSITSKAPGQITISAPPISYFIYTMQSSSSLFPGSWADVLNGQIDDSQFSVTEQIVPGGRRFYRLRIEPP